jgi:hypothetical protein
MVFKTIARVLRGFGGGFDSHTLPPYLIVSETLGLPTREHKGTLSSVKGPRRQQEANHFAVRLSQTFWYSPGVDVHRSANVRVTKQFLLHLYVRAILIEESRIRVAAIPAPE